MLRATMHFPAAGWPEDLAADRLTLDFDARHRRRIRLTTDGGVDVLLDLPKAVAMADGDGLKLDDGRWVGVRAKAEPLLELRCAGARELARLAWHLGNRHAPAEVRADCLRVRPDHVIEALARALGAEVLRVEAPFQPEAGAHVGRGTGGPSHGH
jgi:urease accessory protein